MVSFCVLASGSSGNSCYVSDGKTGLLFDVGLSAIETQRRVESKGFKISSLSAIVVTHEHSDHTRGVGVLSRRFGLPVYMNYETKKVLDNLGKLEDIKLFTCGNAFEIGSFLIQPFSVPHDAVDPAGFVLLRGGIKIAIVTDLGTVTSMIKERIKGCNLLVVEANYDVHMLKSGPYPWYLKQRISSKTGHLSNDSAADLIESILHPNLKHVLLAHLSCKNNTTEAALKSVSPILLDQTTHLHITSQTKGSEIIRL